MKTVEQLTAELAESERLRKEAETKLTVVESTGKKAAAAAELTKLLSESKLPEKAKERLRNQFKEAIDVTGMKEAVVSEQEYIKSLGVTDGGGSVVRNMGEADQGVDKGDKKVSLAESFAKLPGMTKEQAEIAAAGRK